MLDTLYLQYKRGQQRNTCVRNLGLFSYVLKANWLILNVWSVKHHQGEIGESCIMWLLGHVYKKKKKNYSTGFIDWFGWWVLEKGEC